VLRERDLVGLSVVEDREVVLIEVRNQPPLSVNDGGEYGDDARPGLEGRLLRECRRPRQDCKRGVQKWPLEPHMGSLATQCPPSKPTREASRCADSVPSRRPGQA